MIGMLWFDNSKDPLDAKLEKARQYYLDKYGVNPEAIYVHNDNQVVEAFFDEGMKIPVKTSQQVLPCHFLLVHPEQVIQREKR